MTVVLQEGIDQTVKGPYVEPTVVVALEGISKSFGPTLANDQIDLTVHAGEVIGLVGGNGAGKSTLMRILCGGIWPTQGAIVFGDETVPFAHYDTTEAQRRGIRMVHQELSLCTNLSVAENFFLEAPQAILGRLGWRADYRALARASLDAVFPNNQIDVNAKVGHLPIGDRQMVEIARATATPGVRLIVLDEPTSSLDLERSRQLRNYVHSRSQAGLSFIFISHKLQEIIDIASQVAVLRNGRLVWRGDATDASIKHLVGLMGGDVEAIQGQSSTESDTSGKPVIRISGRFLADGQDIVLRQGEIVGLAGLEGSGQKDLLHALFSAQRAGGEVERYASAGFITGDRQKEGIFPLWNVLENISIGRIARRSWSGFVSDETEARAATKPAQQLRLDKGRFESGILELSGGNQQKVLVARTLATDSSIVLLDDPTRGVDIATKQDFYRLCEQIAQEGRTLIWHTTEDAELLAAHRVLVFANGKVVRELTGPEITEEAIVGASFAHVDRQDQDKARHKTAATLVRRLVDMAPFIGLVIVLSMMIWANPFIASIFGIDLLLLPALSLVLVTMAQMFVIGGSEIDLGVGPFASLVSVLAATLLYDTPAYGVIAILVAIAAYGCLGGLIQARKIPAIVVTLGASFIWLGVGYSLQPTPGGASPEWLSKMVNWSVDFVPTSVVLIAIVGLVAVTIDRMPIGVVLRGFGNNSSAMVQSGWSPVRFAMVRYLIAGFFAAAAGLSLTAINTASDVNSGNSFTLLSIAAVVMGGCALLGGIISPIGAVIGAVTLALIGALLGSFGVSSDFNAVMQGLILIALLALRSAVAPRGSEE
ncbi:MAG: ATP-binding cassette domain-containing protein [Candidatus Competibacteraceae bacterium]|nr:ATP-binding cassette domain-containing protein [Candidatus Competibacteraceae bacterium]